MDVLCLSKSRHRFRIWDMGVSKTSDYIQVKIKMQNFSQEPAASSKVPNQHLKHMDALCTIKLLRLSAGLNPKQAEYNLIFFYFIWIGSLVF